MKMGGLSEKFVRVSKNSGLRRKERERRPSCGGMDTPDRRCRKTSTGRGEEAAVSVNLLKGVIKSSVGRLALG